MRINEIFYSLQGEGRYTGTPAIFIRFSGCNLKCSFCDTDHRQGKEMSEEDVLHEIEKYPCKFVVLTGGEPGMRITYRFIDRLKNKGYYTTVETNGTYFLPNNIDWVTCSPKHERVVVERISEVKVVYQGQDMSQYDTLKAEEYYLQPCDYKDKEKNEKNLKETINYIKENPKWKLSLQTQKILNLR